MRAVKQKVWNEAENRERDWGETLARVRLLRHALPISLLILRKKPTVLQSTHNAPLFGNIREFKQRQRRRLRKRHLKSEFTLPQT